MQINSGEDLGQYGLQRLGESAHFEAPDTLGLCLWKRLVRDEIGETVACQCLVALAGEIEHVVAFVPEEQDRPLPLARNLPELPRRVARQDGRDHQRSARVRKSVAVPVEPFGED